MSYISLYRKWRPQSFDEVVGQRHVVRTLSNALDSGRTAHAYLFAGPRGTGKTTIARIFAKGLNCVEGPTSNPCQVCDNCRAIAEGSCVDVIEIDGASNRGIDEVRDLRERIRFAPAQTRFKVYIIDEVHMLTTDAFNALLKTLEEPPGHVVFIFATTEPHKIPSTILSRCQRFDLKRLSRDQVAGHLEFIAARENVKLDRDAALIITEHSQGSMRDAIGILEQSSAFSGEVVGPETVAEVLGVVPQERLFQYADAIVSGDAAESLILIRKLIDEGRDLRQFLVDLIRHFRNLMVAKQVPDAGENLAIPAEYRQRYSDQASRFTLGAILSAMSALAEAEEQVRWASHPAIPLEVCTVKLVQAVGGSGTVAVAGKPSETPEPGVPGRHAPAARPGTSVDGAGLENVLAQVRSYLSKARKRTASALLQEGRLVQLSDREAVIAFAPEKDFARIGLERESGSVEKAFSSVLKRPVAVRFVPELQPAQSREAGDSSGPAGSREPAGASAQVASGAAEEAATSEPVSTKIFLDESDIQDPGVRAALEMFGGRIIKVEKIKEE